MQHNVEIKLLCLIDFLLTVSGDLKLDDTSRKFIYIHLVGDVCIKNCSSAIKYKMLATFHLEGSIPKKKNLGIIFLKYCGLYLR